MLKMAGASICLEKNFISVHSGLKFVKLQAVSREDALDWCINICHSISMENGGGLLLDKEKQEAALHGQDANEQNTAANEVYSSSSVQVVTTSKSNAIETTLDVTQSTQVTEMTDICGTTFNSLDPEEVSKKMEEFALNFLRPSRPRGDSDTDTNHQQWLDIDRISSIVSDEEVLDAYSDIDNCNHINSEDYVRLKRLASGGAS